MDGHGFPAFMMRVRAAGVTDASVLNAVEAVDRSKYLAKEDRQHAWSDHALPLPCGQATERLDDLVAMIAALDVAPHHRVLEIGTGSGFAAAVLAQIAARVISVDRYRTLLRAARERHVRDGFTNIEYSFRDGREGAEADAPIDRVLVTAALPEPPRALIEHLAVDGVVVAPIGHGDGPVPIVRLQRVGVRYERSEIGRGWFLPAERGRARAL